MNNTHTGTKLHKHKVLNPPFNDISPFFSAVIYKIEDKVSIKNLLRLAKIECNKENTDSPRHYFYFDEEFIDEGLGIFTVCQKSIPTWLASRRISRTKDEFHSWEDYNVHLAIIYISGSHLFLSCKNDKVLSLFQRAISNIDSSIISVITKSEFQRTQAFHGEEAKIIGLKNTFGTGNSGKIPESKAYTGKDCKRSLNGITDHVFKLSHIGSTNKENGYSGASINKRKVWGGWTDSLNSFMEVCDNYSISLGDTEILESSPLQCLAQPSDFDEIKDKKPISFSLESVIRRKGVLCLKNDENIYTSWYASLTQFEKDIIEFEMWVDKKTSENCRVKFSFSEFGEIKFEYSSDNLIEPFVVFMNENSTEPRGRDLVKYLNSTDNFVFLFSGGISYSKDGCYKMEKLKNCFFDQSSTEISWGDVDITKEEAKAFHPFKLNILQRVEEFTKFLPNVLFAINDNGSNEVSDIILILKNKVIFIHAKASKGKLPGLRVGDLQVVSSQATKNVNFAVPEPYNNKQLERLFQNSYFNPNGLDLNEFKELFFDSLEDLNIKKEVWIVQPGISKQKLEDNPKNKIHALLSFTEVGLNSAQIDFKLICSE